MNKRNSRDLLNHGAGKGDKDRSNSKAFLAGILSVNMPGKVDGLVKLAPGKFKKVYGAYREPKRVALGRLIIH